MAHLVPSLLSSSDWKNLEAWEGNRRKSSPVVVVVAEKIGISVAMMRKRKRAMGAKVGKVKSVGRMGL